MRNDLQKLVWLSGDIQRAEIMPEDAEGQEILASLIHRTQHDDGQFDDFDADQWLDELNSDFCGSRGC